MQGWPLTSKQHCCMGVMSTCNAVFMHSAERIYSSCHSHVRPEPVLGSILCIQEEGAHACILPAWVLLYGSSTSSCKSHISHSYPCASFHHHGMPAQTCHASPTEAKYGVLTGCT